MPIFEFPVSLMFPAGHTPAVLCGSDIKEPDVQVSPARATFLVDGEVEGTVQVVGAANLVPFFEHKNFALRVVDVPKTVEEAAGKRDVTLRIDELHPGPPWPRKGSESSRDEAYDDDSALVGFVLGFLTDAASPLQKQILGATNVACLAEAESWCSPWRDYYCADCGPEVWQAVEKGWHAARLKIARELDAAGFVNRCPDCGRVVRTPKAKQCFWCGRDWH